MADTQLKPEDIFPEPPPLSQIEGESENGLPEVRLLPTPGVISIGDIAIDAIVSAIVTVLLFRIVFGGTPQELVQDVADAFPRGVVAEQMQNLEPT